MIKIYALSLVKPLNSSLYNFLLGLCSIEKIEKIKVMKIKQNRDNSVLGNALAKYALKDVYGIPIKKQKFVYGRAGKPYLFGSNGIYFSISHSSNLIVCAVSDSPIGVDVQKITKFSNKTAEYITNRMGGEITEKEFFSAWTKREAAIKRTGSGIFSDNINEVNVKDVISFQYKDFYISVAGK